jgi:hypothetical protein
MARWVRGSMAGSRRPRSTGPARPTPRRDRRGSGGPHRTLQPAQARQDTGTPRRPGMKRLPAAHRRRGSREVAGGRRADRLAAAGREDRLAGTGGGPAGGGTGGGPAGGGGTSDGPGALADATSGGPGGAARNGAAPRRSDDDDTDVSEFLRELSSLANRDDTRARRTVSPTQAARAGRREPHDGGPDGPGDDRVGRSGADDEAESPDEHRHQGSAPAPDGRKRRGFFGRG